jgi:SAM-dependent methyltransferase
MSESDYEAYLAREWQMFGSRPSQLAELARKTLAGRQPRRVLDVGCGAGQELLPFAAEAETFGVDINPEATAFGPVIYRREQPALPVPTFQVAPAERLPFADGYFDVVLSRLALPYTDNRQAIAEMSRVLAPQGALVIKIHHLRYYLRQLRRASRRADVREIVHAGRVIAFGTVFELTGWQPSIPRPNGAIREVFQLVTSLTRRLGEHGLRVVEVEDRHAATPAVVAVKIA